MNIVETINMISRAVTAFGDLAIDCLDRHRGEKVERQ